MPIGEPDPNEEVVWHPPPAQMEAPHPIHAVRTDTAPLVFSGITDEQWREYTYPVGKGLVTIRLRAPVGLHVTKKPEGDSHRVITADGHSHYMRAGWVHIEWMVKSGKMPFTL